MRPDVQNWVLLLSGLEKGRKDLAKMPEGCGKDAIFYIQVFGHRPPRKAPHRQRAEEAADGIRPPAGSPGLLRSRLTPSYLGDRSKRSGRAGQKSRMQ